ncbi:NADPH oxidase 5-like isoform X2 [Ptychodera flava]|uniref:NADPH oxidase 5-like isoform X2 n=1 Tax=Ptychodera flava TaxID=63121 RepID=UPI00396A3299
MVYARTDNRASAEFGLKRTLSVFGMDEDTRWLVWVEKQFSDIAGEDRQIDLQEFKKSLKVKKSFFAERFFALFDADGSGSITLEELMDGLRLLLKGSPSDKLKFLFDVYDVDGSGQIDKDELHTVLKSCMEESALQISEENMDMLTTTLFEAADTDRSGAISFEELRAELEKNPEVMENLTISAASWLKPPDEKKRVRHFIPRYLTWRYIHNNLRKVVFLVMYLLVNIALGIEAGWRYREINWYIIVARACGQCLNFNSAFILVLMLRQCLTFLRATKASGYLPLDQNIIFHKMVGLVIGFFTLVHTVAHIGNIIANHDALGLEIWECLFTTKAMVGSVDWHYGTAYLTGWILDLILLVMVVCSMPFVRRSGHFQVFYWTHLLYVWFWAFLLVHGPRFWKWFIAPGVIFLIEKIARSKLVKMARFGKTYIQEANLLPSGVTHLVITRPTNFHFRAGDYIYLQIPAIAKYEWHPFTISSAPEQLGTIWIHVRSAGQWTNRLYKYFEDEKRRAREQRNASIGEVNLAIDMESEDRQNGGIPLTDLNGGAVHRNSLIKEHISKTPSYPIMPTSDEDPKMIGFRRTSSLPTVPVTKTSEEKAEVKDTPMNGHTEIEKSPRVQVQEDTKISVESSSHLAQHVRVYIDGPYGTPTREIMQAEHAILIGAGIGVTPFASILQSIMNRYKKMKQTCPKCNHVWMSDDMSATMRLRKVDFIWINRDQKCFEWFVSLLTLLEMEQAEEGSFDRFLELHMFMTAALGKTDMKGIGLQMALDLLHKKSNRDLITGLKTRTQPGRPEWDKLFTKVAEEGRGKVKVFFCGSPALGKVIKTHCEKFKFKFSKENF